MKLLTMAVVFLVTFYTLSYAGFSFKNQNIRSGLGAVLLVLMAWGAVGFALFRQSH